MNEAGSPDSMTVVNGPEDGTEFPLGRAPFTIGSDAGCVVILSLDSDVEEVHARATSASDGYRIRRCTSSPVSVNGRRVGMMRSRVLRSGGYLKVGHTELVLECAPDGLASRSRGIVSESDAVWAVRKGALGLARLSAKFFVVVPRTLFRHWKLTILLVMVLLYFFMPSFRGLAHSVMNSAVGLGRNISGQLFN